MRVLEVLENEKNNYNNFVAANSGGSFLQSWEWGEWQLALGRQVFRYWILDDTGSHIASILLIKMSLPFGKYYLYAPYGPVGSEEFGVWSGELLQQLKQKFSDAVFVRIEPKALSLNIYPLFFTKTANIQPAKTLVINLEKTEEELLSEMHPKTRYNIKLSQKHSVQIQDEFVLNIGKGFYFEEAINLIVQTAGRQEYGGYGKEYYKKMIDFFSVQNHRGAVGMHIYKAVYQNKLLASAIMLDFGKARTFLFGGSAAENKNVMAPYLLHWQAIQDAKKQGLGIYDFWGIETSAGEVPGFVRFKMGFGGQPKEYPGALDVVIRQHLYKLYKLLRKVNKSIKKISS